MEGMFIGRSLLRTQLGRKITSPQWWPRHHGICWWHLGALLLLPQCKEPGVGGVSEQPKRYHSVSTGQQSSLRKNAWLGTSDILWLLPSHHHFVTVLTLSLRLSKYPQIQRGWLSLGYTGRKQQLETGTKVLTNGYNINFTYATQIVF